MYTHKKQQYNKQGYYACKKNKMNLNIDNLLTIYCIIEKAYIP